MIGHQVKSPSNNTDVINLYDDADRFFRARAHTYRLHMRLMQKRVRSGEITAWEKARLLESIAKDEASAQYWEDKAANYQPQF